VDEHFGTHLDAPAHFSRSGWTVDQIPVERLYRPDIRMDVSASGVRIFPPRELPQGSEP
jgi:kynurenine formamidase